MQMELGTGKSRVRTCEWNSSADTQGSAEGGAGAAAGAGAEIPLQLLEETALEQGDAQKKDESPWEARAGAASVQGPVDPWGEQPMLEQLCWKDLRPCGGPTQGQGKDSGSCP